MEFFLLYTCILICYFTASTTASKALGSFTASSAKIFLSRLISDLLSLAAKLWLKFKNSPVGASFISLHFWVQSKKCLTETKVKPEAIINYNLLWFLIYTYLVGIMNLTWMIFIPALTNSISAIVEYVLSLVNRSRE